MVALTLASPAQTRRFARVLARLLRPPALVTIEGDLGTGKTTLVREIMYTEPAVRGDTSGKVLKPAKLKSGFEIPVPLFCDTGDKIEIDTRTNEYRNRVKG